MRFYGFGNYYLSSLQQGLQSAHCIAELFVNHREEKYDMVFEWARDHKTMVLLNGGNSLSLQGIFDEISNMEGLNLPFAKFHEDEQSLGGALTYVGIIVPAEIYDHSHGIRVEGAVPWDNVKGQLASLLAHYGHAH